MVMGGSSTRDEKNDVEVFRCTQRQTWNTPSALPVLIFVDDLLTLLTPFSFEFFYFLEPEGGFTT